MLIQSLIETDEEVDRAAAHQARLEKLMLAAGGIAGPGSIGMQPAAAEEAQRHEEDRSRSRSWPATSGSCASTIARAHQRPAAVGPRRAEPQAADNRLDARRPDAPDAARALMHGIFVGEIQALEGAGRTCWDFDDRRRADDEAPFALKLDMARQCWDEARHVEISVQAHATGWAPSSASSPRTTFLYEAACNPDPVLRLTGVNRALEGLAIDVFNTMKEFGDVAGDPVLEFCEDWMLADEVTHVKMGSDWLRRLTENDPDRRERALEFQRVVDKLFSLGGFRGEDEDSPDQLARRFRELAGFDDEEIDEIAEISRARRCTRPTRKRARSRELPPQAAVASVHDASRSRRRRSRWSTSTRPRSRRWSRSCVARDRPAGATSTSAIEVDETTPLGRARSRRTTIRS